MPGEILNLTAQLVISHASMTELTPKELITEIKAVHDVLAALDGRGESGEPGSEKIEAMSGVKKPSIPVKDIVTAKYVVCLECGKKLKTLKAHLRKAHGLTPKEYYARFDLDPKKFPLVSKEYSMARSQWAKDRGLGAQGGRRQAGKSA